MYKNKFRYFSWSSLVNFYTSSAT